MVLLPLQVVVDGSTPQSIYDVLESKLREFIESHPEVPLPCSLLGSLHTEQIRAGSCSAPCPLLNRMIQWVGGRAPNLIHGRTWKFA